MITLQQYQLFTEVIILHSPEELSLSKDIFKNLYGNVRINFIPQGGCTSFRLYNSIDDKKYGEIIRYLLHQEGLLSYNTLEPSSYRASTARWKQFRHIYEHRYKF
jgi:hypothetical protein